MSKNERAQFATRLGVLATTVGSAVGLGNIWRFPYEAGVHGGGAFMLVYVFFVLIIGIPVATAEFIIGRHTHSNVYGAFKKLHKSPFWKVSGVIGIVASLMILSFYSVVAGWTFDYILRSLQNFNGAQTQEALHAEFNQFTSSWESVVWTLAFLLVNYLIIRRGVQNGIEKMSNILMPALFIILLAFCVNSLFMPGVGEGLEFLFKPDFSSITPSVLMGAMGQAFFSLSLGLGGLITYSSYFSSKTKLLNSAASMAGLDTLVAIFAGIIIFPAVFTFGESPAEGPKLVFEVLPSIFLDMKFGHVWSVLFFVLLFLASLTSTISMSEISIAYFTEERHMSRRNATLLNTAIAMVFGALSALSFGPLRHITICGLGIFDLLDYLSSTILLPLGGMIISIFVGWVMKRSVIYQQLDVHSPAKARLVKVVIFCLRYVAPTCILLVFLSGLGVIRF